MRGSHRIIHAGDIGAPEIIAQLAKIAPVTAVRGNIDKDAWARNLPETDVLELDGITVYV
ncbi:MAG: metallophosphoesterase family protein, partial [Candidatus Sulfotelmatobacter sp.]